MPIQEDSFTKVEHEMKVAGLQHMLDLIKMLLG